MGYIETRTGRQGETSYKAQVRLKGHPTVTQTFERKSDASKWIQDTESTMRSGEYLAVNEAKKHTLSEAIDRFIAEKLTDRKRYSQPISKLEWFKKAIGFKRLSDVTPSVIADCRRQLKAEVVRGKNRTGPTANRYASQLSAVFEYVQHELYWCNRNPVRQVRWEREHDGVVRFLSDDEKTRLLDACRVDECRLIYPVVVLALSSGMRKSEIHYLRWEDVDLEKGVIILPKTRTKSRTARRVPLRGLALELIRELREHQQGKKIVRLRRFVFSNDTSERPFDLRPAWDRVRDRATLEKFRFHDLRHSCASFLVMNGASLLEIAEILGHKTLIMVKRYSHLAESHTANVVERMNQKVFGN